MSKTIPQLRSMWNRGADSYKTQEVGSGVQGFVKDVLECTDIFNLKEGELSTPTENRKRVKLARYYSRVPQEDQLVEV